MAPKSYTHGLPQYVSEVKKAGKVTGYKYQRRIPQKLQELHPIKGTDRVKKMWDFYLGADLLGAIIKAHNLREEHDARIAQLTDNLPEVVIRGADKLMARQVSKQQADGSARAPSWRNAAQYLETVRGLPDGMEQQALAVFAATSFGDRTYINGMRLSETFSQLANTVADTPPSGGTDLIMFNAMQEALHTRLAELDVKSNDPAARVSKRMEQYIAYKKSASNTARGYRGMISRFTAFAGDLELAQIDAPLLRRYRDHLINGDDENKAIANVKPYFYPLKALFNWALKEDLVTSNPLDRVDLPHASRSIEETKWQAFDDKEIAKVWDAISHAWGPDGDSRMDLERRRCFLVAFRVLLFTGMRPNEVFKLESKQVQPTLIDIKKTKTGAARKIPLANAISDFYDVVRSKEWKTVASLYNPSNKMSDSFTKIIRRAGITNDRQVLYSAKDTLVDRLEGLGASENIQRTIIGHSTGRAALRHYKTAATVEQMREYLDKIVYCPGLGDG